MLDALSDARARLRREPAVVLALVTAVIDTLIVVGLIPVESVGMAKETAVVMLTLVLGAAVRQKVTPVDPYDIDFEEGDLPGMSLPEAEAEVEANERV